MEKEIDMKDSENNGVTDTGKGEDPNEHIKDYLKNYFEQETKPKFAVMLTGEWGCGKTWLMDEVMKTYAESKITNKKKKRENKEENANEKATKNEKAEPLKQNSSEQSNKKNKQKSPKEKKEEKEIEKKESDLFMKLSLYGMKDTSEIDEAIFQKINPILASESLALAANIVGGIFKVASKLNVGGVEKIFGGIEKINVKKTKEIFLKKLSKIGKKIVVFDDIERCRIPHEELFGYINKFVEHEGSKVVILSNEKELFPNSEDAKGNPKRYKEKIVGATLTLEAKKEEAYKVFTNSLDCEKAKELLNEYEAEIFEVFDKAGDNNLRNLRQAILALPYFLRNFSERMLKDLKLERNYFNGLHGQHLDTAKIIKNYFYLSLEEKKGTVNADNYIDAHTVFFYNEMSYSNFLQMEENEKRAGIQETIDIKRTTTTSPNELTCAEFFNAVVLHKSIKATLQGIHQRKKPVFKRNEEIRKTTTWQLIFSCKKPSIEQIEKKYDVLLEEIKNDEIDDIELLFNAFAFFLNISNGKPIETSKGESIPISKHKTEEIVSIANASLNRRLKKGDKVKADFPYFFECRLFTTFYENGSDIMIQLIDSYSKKLKEARGKQLKVELQQILPKILHKLASKEDSKELEKLGETLNKNFSKEPLLSYTDKETRSMFSQKNRSLPIEGIELFTNVLTQRYSDESTGQLKIPYQLIPEQDFVTSFISNIRQRSGSITSSNTAKRQMYKNLLFDLEKIESAFDAAEESLSVKSE